MLIYFFNKFKILLIILIIYLRMIYLYLNSFLTYIDDSGRDNFYSRDNIAVVSGRSYSLSTVTLARDKEDFR